MLRDLGLYKYGAFFRVYTYAEPVDKHLSRKGPYIARVRIVGRKGMPVCDKEEGIIAFLEFFPVD